MKIQTKFVGLTTISLFLVISLSLTNHFSDKKRSEYLRKVEHIGAASAEQLQALAKFSNVRSDVLSAAVGHYSQNDVRLNAAEKSFYSNVDDMRTQLAALEKENDVLSEDIVADVKKSRALAETYINQAEEIFAAMRRGQAEQRQLDDMRSVYLEALNLQYATTDKLRTYAAAMANEADDYGHRVSLIMKVLGIVVLGSVIAIPVLTTQIVFRPQRRLINTMSDLSHGKFDTEVEGTARNDEMGEIAQAVQAFKESGLERVKLEQQQAQQRQQDAAEQKKREARAIATDAFANRMKGIIESVAAAATQMYRSSEAMGYSISSTSTRVGNVASASTQTSLNVQSVAAAAEELTATVREIAEQIARSNSTVREAVGQVATADTTAQALGSATKEIGQIVDVIQSIASQINLLALNATIESARAGEAGKGFAVVAGEVKTLATQTSNATAEIATNIASIQSVSQEMITALQSIKGAISRVEEIAAAISAAVEEQNATTNEIAGNMGTAASGTAQINDEINQVSVATAESSDSASQVLEAAKEVSQQAEQLSREVANFLAEMNQ